MMRSLVALCLLLTGAVTPLAAQQTVPGRASGQRILVRGFLDFEYLHADRPTGGGFSSGQLSGQIQFRPADRWRVVGELAVRGTTSDVAFALDRLLVGYAAHPALRVTLGRHLTPFGWWNANIARGGWLQTTITRPEMLDRTRELLPLYSLGIVARGRIFDTGALDLGYVAGVTNGRGTALNGARAGQDANRNRAWLFGLRVHPGFLPNLRAGALVYNDNVALSFLESEADERIFSGHVAWRDEPVELLAEYARVLHTLPGPSGSPAFNYESTAFYLEIAMRLPGGLDALKPYVRWDRINVDDGDPVLPIGTDYDGTTLGIRYDFSDIGALKAEYRNERFGAGARAGTLALQLSVRLGEAVREPLLAVAPPGEAPSETTRTRNADRPQSRPAAPPDGRTSASAGAGTPSESVPANPVAIVAHPDTPVDSLSLPELRRIFRGERQFWSDGNRIILLVRSPLARERQTVLGQIYRMNEEEFKQLWLSKVFRNAAATGPKMVEDVDTALELVSALPGAISFISASRLDPAAGLRVIPIDGKLPGEPGYPLQ